MDKTQCMLYEYAKERYSWEHSRKNDLNSSVTVPLGIVTVQITGFSYFVLNFPKINSEILLFISFIVFLILSALGLIFSIALFIKHQIGYTYANITSPKEMDDYRNETMETYKKENGNIDYDSLYNTINNTMYFDYIKCTETNIDNNEKKTQHYRHLFISNTVSAIFLIIALFLFLNLT